MNNVILPKAREFQKVTVTAPAQKFYGKDGEKPSAKRSTQDLGMSIQGRFGNAKISGWTTQVANETICFKALVLETASKKLDQMNTLLAQRSGRVYEFHMGTFFFKDPITHEKNSQKPSQAAKLAFSELLNAFEPWITKAEADLYRKII